MERAAYERRVQMERDAGRDVAGPGRAGRREGCIKERCRWKGVG